METLQEGTSLLSSSSSQNMQKRCLFFYTSWHDDKWRGVGMTYEFIDEWRDPNIEARLLWPLEPLWQLKVSLILEPARAMVANQNNVAKQYLVLTE